MHQADSFKLLQVESVEKLLKDGQEADNHTQWTMFTEPKHQLFIKEQLEQFLGLDKGKSSKWGMDEWLKALMQILRVDGFLKTEHIPQVTVSDIRKGAMKVYAVGGQNPAVPGANWNYLDFLIFHIYFLVVMLLNIQKGQYAPLPCPKDELCSALKNELLITANAYRIFSTYNEIYETFKDLSSEKFKESLKLFAKNLSIAISSSQLQQVCIPCGNKDHAICVIGVKYTSEDGKEKVLLRLDDPSKERPVILGGIDLKDLDQNEKFINYIVDICISH